MSRIEWTHAQPPGEYKKRTVSILRGAPERIGIVVLAGTGSIAYGADRRGRTARSGGYGFLLADEGSGYWFGHQALRAVVRASDGRGPSTLHGRCW